MKLSTRMRVVLLGNRRRIAGTVYGTIVTLSVVTAAAKAFDHDLGGLAVILAVTTVVFWVAHVYSRGLGESIDAGRRLTAAEVATIARRESSILLAGVLPLLAIVLGALGVFADRTALWIAIGTGILTLTVQGIRYAQLEQLSRTGTIITIVINLAIGLSIAVLKVLVSH